MVQENHLCFNTQETWGPIKDLASHHLVIEEDRINGPS